MESLLDSKTQTPGPARRKLFVKSYGCQMNVYDAARMADVLAPEGFSETNVIEDADLVILNTCHIRERASEKIFSELGKVRLVKDARAKAGLTTKIAVAGCVAQAEGAEILRRQKSVDIVVGPQSYHRLPDLLHRAENGAKIVDTEFPAEDKFDHLPAPSRGKIQARGLSAFVTVQEGCDKFCTFCVVPFTRGAEVSRPITKILDEAEALADAGVREITLLGQNVNAFHGLGPDGKIWPLARLIRRLAEINGIARLRYMTSHPNDMDDDLICAHGDCAALMPFLHLPVQSGSDTVLDAMNRKHTHADYRAVIDKVRRARPDIALSSDFIVGFPGESEADFEATLDLVRDINFASAYSFKYSSRPGTSGAAFGGQIDEAVKQERLLRLQELLDAQRQSFNRAAIGTRMDVLIEKRGRNAGQIAGKSRWLQPVQIDAPDELIGRVISVEITAVSTNSLFGALPRAHAEGHPQVMLA